MNCMERTRRINQKYEQGLQDGRLGIYAPGLTFGIYRTMYHKGYKQGARMRTAAKRLIKTK